MSKRGLVAMAGERDAAESCEKVELLSEISMSQTGELEAIVMTPEHAGKIIGRCQSVSAKAHVAAAIIGSHFNCEVHGKCRGEWLYLKIWGDEIDFADQILDFASAFRHIDGERVFERVIISVAFFRDSGVMS